MITFEITLGDKPRECRLDPDDIPLILLEAMSEGQWGPMREALAELIGLTDAESKKLTIRHLKQIGQGIKEATTIPNG